MSYDAWVFPLYLSAAVRHRRDPRDRGVARAAPARRPRRQGHPRRLPRALPRVLALRLQPGPGARRAGHREHVRAVGRVRDGAQSVPSKTLARGDNPLPMETLRPLSREYRQVLVDDQELRKIEFHNPTAADPDLHVRALVRRADGSWTSENWDGRTKVEFCRDEPDQDVREVILAYSNSSLDRRFAPPTALPGRGVVLAALQRARRERPVPDRTRRPTTSCAGASPAGSRSAAAATRRTST